MLRHLASHSLNIYKVKKRMWHWAVISNTLALSGMKLDSFTISRTCFDPRQPWNQLQIDLICLYKQDLKTLGRLFATYVPFCHSVIRNLIVNVESILSQRIFFPSFLTCVGVTWLTWCCGEWISCVWGWGVPVCSMLQVVSYSNQFKSVQINSGYSLVVSEGQSSFQPMKPSLLLFFSVLI